MYNFSKGLNEDYWYKFIYLTRLSIAQLYIIK